MPYLGANVYQGMLLAAGLGPPYRPGNSLPAPILKLKPGVGVTRWGLAQVVIDQVTEAGVLVVASAGNTGGHVETPAACPGAMAIAGLTHRGTKAPHSSLGSAVALGAPAGDCVIGAGGPCLHSLDTTT